MREMLRIKRSVQAMYNTQVNMMSAQMLNSSTNQVNESMDAMKILDTKAPETNSKYEIYFSFCFILGTRINQIYIFNS